MNEDRAPTATGARRGTTETQVDIDASPERIWALVADLEGWGEWNPLYPRMQGTARAGNRISMTVHVPDLKPQEVAAVVLVADAPHRLVYEGRPMAGLVRARRYVEIVAKDGQSCRVVNGEEMGGLLGPLIAKLVGPKVRRGLEAMNAALKQKAQAER